ncbi:MAG TPA: hypothetical protein VGZ25_12360 [Gemmataceae bacterium]|jgi:hypothetical protein|nr:hypothetical protein [Gemmataceae bacterium]
MTDDNARLEDDVIDDRPTVQIGSYYSIKAKCVTINSQGFQPAIQHCGLGINAPPYNGSVPHGTVPAEGTVSAGAARTVDGTLMRTSPPPSTVIEHIPNVPVTNGHWTMTFTNVPIGAMLLVVSCGCGSGSIPFKTT